MAHAVKEGDRVQIVVRDPNAEDAKSGLYYRHFQGLVGTVQKVYATGEVAVDVDLESLEEAIATRHREVQEQMKNRWLDGLSEEARNRLTDAEKLFRLRYVVLVHARDLTAPRETPAPRATTADLFAAEEASLDSLLEM
ncbi:MAG: hypothetical protein RMJ43_11370 [Chloroherpetonaceae bacterium]|nr:hypothetical protein [Chthonomonadaceae bacterium]MDW8208429.1 hypothetical protein [Chloroherpetonaceae bacterium]